MNPLENLLNKRISSSIETFFWKIKCSNSKLLEYIFKLEQKAWSRNKISVTSDMQSMDRSIYKIRPIISCVGGPTDRISWFLNKIVSQLLRKVSAHLTNTNQFLEHLRRTNFDQHCVMESFDVTSLYTNVSNSDAMEALSGMLEEYDRSIECMVSAEGVSWLL